MKERQIFLSSAAATPVIEDKLGRCAGTAFTTTQLRLFRDGRWTTTLTCIKDAERNGDGRED
jgi:hypothetical protein